MNDSIKASNDKISGLFVYFGNSMDQVPGGVQICSREYFDALTTSGFSLRTVKIENDRSITSRLKRKLDSEPYNHQFNSEKAIEYLKKSIDESVEYIFLNQYLLRPLAKLIKENIDQKIVIVLLSHGLASVDYLHEIRASRNLTGKSVPGQSISSLGKQLIEETSHAQYLDHVFCLSTIEAEIEKWLGAKKTTHIPRTIHESKLDWTPIAGRLGFVGRLDHPPNKEGLILVLEELNRVRDKEIELRIVGAPLEEGVKLSEKYEFVNYLGELSEEELREDASTWSLFLHPVFYYAMGCSTKLAVAIGWEIPILTTTAGMRGYVWKEGSLPIEDMPQEFAKSAIKNSDPSLSKNIKDDVSMVKKSSPDLNVITSLIKDALSIK